MKRQKVLLVGPDQEENLSLRYLASALVNAGHDVVIAPFNRGSERGSVVAAAADATLVGLSLCFQVRAPEFLALARELKALAPDRPVVAGGHFASCAAEDLLTRHEELDLVVIHEGEQTFVEIADAAHAGELRARLEGIRGLAFRDGDQVRFSEARPLLADLDRLAPPLRIGPARLLAGVPTSYVLGSRGCVGSCNYCCITTLHRMVPGRRFRQRDPARIADEMAHLYHECGVRQFIFHDDNFLVPSEEKNHRRLDALEGALDEREVREIAFTIKCRPQDVRRPVFERLRDLGLIRVFLGIESASEEGLACLGRQHSRDDAVATLELCRELGISAQYTMMIFHPDATLGSCRADLEFMRRHVDYPLNFCRTEIYAGTPLERRMIAEGRARGSYLGRSYTIDDGRVERICALSARLFLARCWSTGSLFERSIGLDHLAAVLRRFYRGRRPAKTSDRIAAWLRAVNQDTIDLLGELIDLGAALEGDAWQHPEVVALREREQASRLALFREGLDLFEQLNELTLPMVGLGLRDRSVFVDRSRPLERLARHAAAALLAVSVASFGGCDKDDTPSTEDARVEVGQSEYAPPPVDGGVDAVDASVDFGHAEFAPPPVDGGEGGVKVDFGHAEFAPPPVDGGSVKVDFGHAEFAPPPVDAGKKKDK